MTVTGGMPDVGWPIGTLAVNLAGSFLLGFLVSASPAVRRPWLIPLLGVGALGAFTTFGTFVHEIWALGAARRWWMAAAYLVASIFGGLAAALLGGRIGARR